MANNTPRLEEIIKTDFFTKLSTKSIPNFLRQVDKNTSQQAEIWDRKIYEITPKIYLPTTIQERFGARLIASLKIPKNGVVVDLGCFLGEKLWQLPKRRDYLAIGVDVVLSALKIAKKVGFPNHKFIVADAQDLPFKDNSVDVVLAFDVIEHLTSPKEGFAEIARILKPGGKLLLHIPIKDNKWSMFWWKQKIFPKAAEKDYLDVGHFSERMLTTGQIKKFLTKYGLKMEREIYYNSFFVHFWDREFLKILASFSAIIFKSEKANNQVKATCDGTLSRIRTIYGRYLVPVLEILSWPDWLLSKLKIGNTYFCIAKKI